MGLPKILHPTFSLVLPSTKQTIHFRPFLVKEEKILLIAQASEDKADIVKAIKQVVQNCIIEEDIDVNDFTTFDLEFFFIRLRSKSVQNIVKLSYKDREDGKIYDIVVDLDTIEVKGDSAASNKIELSPTSGIMLRYPRVSITEEIESINDPVEFNFAIIQACIDCVYDGDNVYRLKDFTRQEVKEYIDSLDVKTYQAIQSFIDAMPAIEHTVSYTNTKGREVSIVLRTITDFFSLG
jgi:hypothetical protein